MTMRVRVAALVLGLLGAVPSAAAEKPQALRFGRFGTLHVYPGAQPAQRVILLVSGDNGWDARMTEMARAMGTTGAWVVGVDILAYLRDAAAARDACTYSAADFEALSKFVQRKLKFPRYLTPALAGYSSGATLVYAVLAEGPANTFQGAVSLGFCPDLDLKKPLCKGSGLAWTGAGMNRVFQPATHLRQSWVALSGGGDKACPLKTAKAFADKVPRGSLVELPKVGHGFRVSAEWLPAFRDAFEKLYEAPPPVVPLVLAPPPDAEAGATGADAPVDDPGGDRDLPLVEVPASGEGAARLADAVAVIVSGDGGWAGIDREIGEAIAAQGIPVVGLNSLKYFWTARTPDEAAGDVEWLIRHYLHAWGRRHVLLVGYSLGADVMPFLFNRLADDVKARTVLIGLLGLSRSVSFEFHVSDWVGGGADDEKPVVPEAARMRGHRVLCLYGSDEDDSACRDLPPGLAKVVEVKGGHHFGGDYEALARRILVEAAAP